MRKIYLSWAISLALFAWTTAACTTTSSSNLQPEESGGAVTAVFEDGIESNDANGQDPGPGTDRIELVLEGRPENPDDVDDPENRTEGGGNSSGVMVAQITSKSQFAQKVVHKPLSLGTDCGPSTVLAEGSTDEAGKVEIWHMSVPQSCTIHFTRKYSPAPFCVISSTKEFLVVTQTEDYLAFSKPDMSSIDHAQAIFYHCKFPKAEGE